MKNINRFTALVLAGMVVLTGCSSGETSNLSHRSDDGDTVTTAQIADTADTEEEFVPVTFKRGKFENGVYTNEAVGIRLDLGDGWEAETDSEVAERNDISEDDMTDEKIEQYLNEGNIFIDALANSNSGFWYITYEDLYATLHTLNIDEDEYCNSIVDGNLEDDGFIKGREEIGSTNVSAEKSEVTVFGRTLPAISYEETQSGVRIKGICFYFIKGQYLAQVHIESTVQDEINTIINSFSEIDATAAESSSAETASTDTFSRGTFENGVYTNSAVGIRCDLGDGWEAGDHTYPEHDL